MKEKEYVVELFNHVSKKRQIRYYKRTIKRGTKLQYEEILQKHGLGYKSIRIPRPPEPVYKTTRISQKEFQKLMEKS